MTPDPSRRLTGGFGCLFVVFFFCGVQRRRRREEVVFDQTAEGGGPAHLAREEKPVSGWDHAPEQIKECPLHLLGIHLTGRAAYRSQLLML